MKRFLSFFILVLICGAPQAWAQEDGKLSTSYGWVDRDKGIVRIPIGRAMELTIERYSKIQEETVPVPETIEEAIITEERAEPPVPIVIDEAMALKGKEIFEEFKCHTCHGADAIFPGPNHVGLYYRKVKLSDGEVIVADETYIRESILDPTDKLVEGYDPTTMLSYEGLLAEDEILALIEYIRSL